MTHLFEKTLPAYNQCKSFYVDLCFVCCAKLSDDAAEYIYCRPDTTSLIRTCSQKCAEFEKSLKTNFDDLYKLESATKTNLVQCSQLMEFESFEVLNLAIAVAVVQEHLLLVQKKFDIHPNEVPTMYVLAMFELMSKTLLAVDHVADMYKDSFPLVGDRKNLTWKVLSLFVTLLKTLNLYDEAAEVALLHVFRTEKWNDSAFEASKANVAYFYALRKQTKLALEALSTVDTQKDRYLDQFALLIRLCVAVYKHDTSLARKCLRSFWKYTELYIEYDGNSEAYFVVELLSNVIRAARLVDCDWRRVKEAKKMATRILARMKHQNASYCMFAQRCALLDACTRAALFFEDMCIVDQYFSEYEELVTSYGLLQNTMEICHFYNVKAFVLENVGSLQLAVQYQQKSVAICEHLFRGKHPCARTLIRWLNEMEESIEE